MRKVIFFLILIWYAIVATDAHAQIDSLNFGAGGLVPVEEYTFPELKKALIGFAVIDTVGPIIPIGSRLYAPKLNKWIKSEGALPISSVEASLFDNSLYLLSPEGDSITLIKCYEINDNRPNKKLCKLAKGYYNIVENSPDTLFVWGYTVKGNSAIIQVTGHLWKNILTSERTISCVVPISNHQILYAVDNEILLLNSDKKVFRIVMSDSPIESFALGENGIIYISTLESIFEFNNGIIKEVISDMHGILRFYNGRLYLLYQEKNKILKF